MFYYSKVSNRQRIGIKLELSEFFNMRVVKNMRGGVELFVTF